ncbi:hypothetical protein CRV15_35265 (plasmid) [Streptomyces clavuligerus]|uniref:Uncharacterized protein n=1 Tax=Streptomyces clavuligerus TaxID=1901 RepID=B5GLU5_STRCL|nr:hypothetical protein SSCG_00319 [Streptomyces clavuligerus]EFG04953.1 Hypothetical protein SCLAV_p1471 [Streptomyces clavuligerus]QCS10778.1 hypothetical protein CRV15_35265 [Streptomyces clavuligerus]QPJ97188.1 hypothetical protein GE265_29220 [Streptomyces clavuligerus]
MNGEAPSPFTARTGTAGNRTVSRATIEFRTASTAVSHRDRERALVVRGVPRVCGWFSLLTIKPPPSAPLLPWRCPAAGLGGARTVP